MFLLSIRLIKPQPNLCKPRFDESGDQGGDEAAAHEAPVVAGVDGDGGPGGQSQRAADPECEGHGLDHHHHNHHHYQR